MNQVTKKGTPPIFIAAQEGQTEAVHILLRSGADGAGAFNGLPALHIAAKKGHRGVIRAMAESWPLDRRPWYMFLFGGGGESELRDYLAPPANRETRNFLPILYKPEMMKEIWKFLHKPRYVDLGKLDSRGRTAQQVAAAYSKRRTAALLRTLAAAASKAPECLACAGPCSGCPACPGPCTGPGSCTCASEIGIEAVIDEQVQAVDVIVQEGVAGPAADELNDVPLEQHINPAAQPVNMLDVALDDLTGPFDPEVAAVEGGEGDGVDNGDDAGLNDLAPS